MNTDGNSGKMTHGEYWACVMRKAEEVIHGVLSQGDCVVSLYDAIGKTEIETPCDVACLLSYCRGEGIAMRDEANLTVAAMSWVQAYNELERDVN